MLYQLSYKPVEGGDGLEPSRVGIKTPCLTSLANPLRALDTVRLGRTVNRFPAPGYLAPQRVSKLYRYLRQVNRLSGEVVGAVRQELDAPIGHEAVTHQWRVAFLPRQRGGAEGLAGAHQD